MIEPIAYQKPLEGKSNAHLIRFNDGRDYVVKSFKPEFEKALPNEWVAYCLARFLGLPIPFAKIVEIPQDFLNQVPELAVLSGTQHHFISLYEPNCYDGHQVPEVTQILNHQSLAGIILFDYWLCNRDRTRKNILLREEMPGSYRLWIIDHSEIFGSFNWVHPYLETIPIRSMKSATHQLMASFIDDERSFAEQLERIQTIPILLLEEIVSVIPDDWQISVDDRKDIVSTLVRRRKKVLPQLIHKFVKNVYRPLNNGRS